MFSLAAAFFLAGTFMGTMLAVWSTGQPYWLVRYFVPQPMVGEEWLLNVMVPGFDASSLSDEVYVYDNTQDTAREDLPIPDPAAAFAGSRSPR